MDSGTPASNLLRPCGKNGNGNRKTHIQPQKRKVVAATASEGLFHKPSVAHCSGLESEVGKNISSNGPIRSSTPCKAALRGPAHPETVSGNGPGGELRRERKPESSTGPIFKIRPVLIRPDPGAYKPASELHQANYYHN